MDGRTELRGRGCEDVELCLLRMSCCADGTRAVDEDSTQNTARNISSAVRVAAKRECDENGYKTQENLVHV